MANTQAMDTFVAEAKAGGWHVECKVDVLTISKTFTPGDRDAYVACDGVACDLLALAPMTYPGSVWGTDGASVGGHAGLTGGYYRMSKSGVSRRFVSGVAKRLAS